MPRGRNGNQTYTGFNGASDSQLRSLRLSGRSAPNRQERKLPPSQESMRHAIAAGLCPFCGKSFKNTAAHTNRTHGVSADELKELLGIPRSHPVCAPETSEAHRRARKKTSTPERMERMRSARRGGKRKMSEAGNQVNRDKLSAWRESTGDGGQQQRLEAMQSSKRRQAEVNEPKYQEAFRLIRDGYMLKDVAGYLGLNRQVLSNKWRQRYPDIDLRSVRHQAKRLRAGDEG